MIRAYHRDVSTVAAACCVFLLSCSSPDGSEFPELRGDYLGQAPPQGIAELFAPDVVSTGAYTRDIAMTPDGSELYYGVMLGRFSVIMQTRLRDGRWTAPEVAPFSQDPQFLHLEPHISPDGQRFYFLSTRPPDGGPQDPDDVGAWVHQDIWAMDRVGDGWGEPYNLGLPVNTDSAEYFPSVTRDGTLYFSRSPEGTGESYIYRSRLVDGQYAEPERLGPAVNPGPAQYNAFIAPDQSYLIVCMAGRDDGYGGSDYYVVFRSDDDVWDGPINMGGAVNSPRAEMSPYVSPDGRYFLFSSARWGAGDEVPERLTAQYLAGTRERPGNGNAAVYWIDAAFIEDLRPREGAAQPR